MYNKYLHCHINCLFLTQSDIYCCFVWAKFFVYVLYMLCITACAHVIIINYLVAYLQCVSRFQFEHLDSNIESILDKKKKTQFLHVFTLKFYWKNFNICAILSFRLTVCLALVAFSSEGSFTCHTCCKNIGPLFIRSH